MSNNIDTLYELGDLLLVVFPDIVSTNQILMVYKSYDSDLNQARGYTLDKDGRAQRIVDNDESYTGIYRKETLCIPNFDKCTVTIIENPYILLDSAQQYYYNEIQSRIP